ncbi:hypothetical protein [Neobacillus dielmonensis]|uniref:hypothetical protein n=1 Tax=Neobacillus dielmonensis TaxID=1347369 RepID=UPI0006949BFF|nr:hypothetical protein [Neobacillus dielmonensis]
MESYDLFVFGGQSNMAGRGEAEKAPYICGNMVFEFRAISDPTRLYKMVEPFGAAENNSEGIYEPNKKTESLVSSFVKSITS